MQFENSVKLQTKCSLCYVQAISPRAVYGGSVIAVAVSLYTLLYMSNDTPVNYLYVSNKICFEELVS